MSKVMALVVGWFLITVLWTFNPQRANDIKTDLNDYVWADIHDGVAEVVGDVEDAVKSILSDRKQTEQV